MVSVQKVLISITTKEHWMVGVWKPLISIYILAVLCYPSVWEGNTEVNVHLDVEQFRICYVRIPLVNTENMTDKVILG